MRMRMTMRKVMGIMIILDVMTAGTAMLNSRGRSRSIDTRNGVRNVVWICESKSADLH